MKVHRTVVDPGDVIRLEDAEGVVRLTTPLRTAWDIGTLEPMASAVAYLDAMVRARHLTSTSLERLTKSARRRWGARRFAKAAALVDGRSESRPESLVRVACLRAGLPAPIPQFVVIADGQFLGKVDLAWPEERLIVEYEGEHHFDDLQIRRDDHRYEQLVAAGWTVIRLSSADLRSLDEVVIRIRAALGHPLIAS